MRRHAARVPGVPALRDALVDFLQLADLPGLISRCRCVAIGAGVVRRDGKQGRDQRRQLMLRLEGDHVSPGLVQQSGQV